LFAHKHMSPFEHVATPIPLNDQNFQDMTGVTHRDIQGDSWSGNFRKFIQYRKLVEVRS